MTGQLILLIEDEIDLARTLEYSLDQEGFRVRVAASGEAGLEQAQLEPIPDLVLLDIMLPDISGTEVLRRLRGAVETQHTPIIITSAKGEEIDRVVGFELGADDYVPKPYSIRELVLRIRALLRRSQVKDVEAVGRIAVGRLRIDVLGHRAWVDDREVSLTTLEFKLLYRLIECRGRVQSRDSLLEEVWGFNADITTRTVDMHIMRLRQKLEPIQDYIETLRGVGYRIRERDPKGE